MFRQMRTALGVVAAAFMGLILASGCATTRKSAPEMLTGEPEATHPRYDTGISSQSVD